MSARRSIVTTSKSVGKELNSKGVPIHRATMRIRTDNAREIAKPRSRKKGGKGINNIARMRTIPTANPMSRLAPLSLAKLKGCGFVSGVATLS